MSTRILVMNDSQETLELFRELLEEEGYEVVLYTYAPQELNEVERVQPDLIILDLMFGAENLGWQLLQKLKMRRSTAMIPVLICTAVTRRERELESYLRAHGVTLIAKPFDIDVFIRIVHMQLEKRKRVPVAGVSVESGGQNGHEHEGARAKVREH